MMTFVLTLFVMTIIGSILIRNGSHGDLVFSIILVVAFVIYMMIMIPWMCIDFTKRQQAVSILSNVTLDVRDAHMQLYALQNFPY